MDPVNSLNNLAKMLRQQVASDKQVATKSRADRASQQATSIPQDYTVEQRVKLKIAELRRTSRSQSSIRRNVIELVLANEFGDAVYTEPRFVELVDKMCRYFESEKAALTTLDTAIRNLS